LLPKLLPNRVQRPPSTPILALRYPSLIRGYSGVRRFAEPRL
jgi:hypothetical protein